MQDEASIPRRALLQGAAVIGASALVGSVIAAPREKAIAQEKPRTPSAQADVQYGFLVRTSNCTGCGQCVEACRRANHTPDDVPARRTVQLCTTASKQEVHVSTACMHCEDPACVTVCPAHAISKGDGGVVTVDHDRCIGCKYCFQACPFGVPHYTSEGMDKCDCCLEAGIELGEKPSCVRACKFRALNYGTLDELMAGSGNRARRIDSPTGPSYLLQ